MAAAKLSFKSPTHGWLPVRVQHGESTIEFVASHTPNNPVQDLIGALSTALLGSQSEVWWNLEPDGYYFEFTPQPEGFQFRVLYAERSERARQAEVCAAIGSRNELLLPIWRALRQFESFGPEVVHWPNVEFSDLHRIREALRE